MEGLKLVTLLPCGGWRRWKAKSLKARSSEFGRIVRNRGYVEMLMFVQDTRQFYNTCRCP